MGRNIEVPLILQPEGIDAPEQLKMEIYWK